MRLSNPSENRILACMLGLLLTACGERGGAAVVPAEDARALYERGREVAERVEAGKADPQADAAAAIARKDFGLLTFAYGMGGSDRPVGVTCFTPWMKAPRVQASLGGGDYITEKTSRLLAYGEAYNHLIVEHPDFPDADICLPESRGDPRIANRDLLPTYSARTPAREPWSIHEAARRGTVADLRKYPKSAVNSIDGVGMTPLSWAVVRGNAPAVADLIEAGADPWRGGDGQRGSAVYWAAILGRTDNFERFARMPGKPFTLWPVQYLTAAAKGSLAIFQAMLKQPHEPIGRYGLPYPMPSLDVLEVMLREEPALANELLWRAVERPEQTAPVNLALRFVEDPDVSRAGSGTGTPLGAVANGIYPASPDIVDILLKAGADPNRLSGPNRPLWIAVRTLKLDGRVDEIDGRAVAIFNRLVQAGADLNLPDAQGVPPIRMLLFPASYDRNKLDASYVTSPLIEMLVRHGLDLNATWQGRRVLGQVEEQAGSGSELAATLRRLGAKR